MKILYRVALVLWLACGLAMRAYYTRVATPAANQESQRLRQVAHSEADRDAAYRRIGEIWGDLRIQQVRTTAIWGFVGFLLALRGVNLMFRKADRVADVEKFLAASLLLALLAGGPAPGPAAMGDPTAPVVSHRA